MTRNNRNRLNAITGNNLNPSISGDFRLHNSPETPTKPNPKFLSLVLQALIMAFVISLFFIFIGVAAIIFLHLCIAGGALRHRRNQRRPNSRNMDSSSGYSLELLNTLPKSRFKGCEVCAICLDNVSEGEFCRILPSCKHVFHLNCVDKWILKSPVCPVCRSSVRLLDHHEDKRKGAFDWEQLWASCGYCCICVFEAEACSIMESFSGCKLHYTLVQLLVVCSCIVGL